jgi:hypothetical protein
MRRNVPTPHAILTFVNTAMHGWRRLWSPDRHHGIRDLALGNVVANGFHDECSIQAARSRHRADKARHDLPA